MTNETGAGRPAPLNTVDDEARRLARRLLRSARFGALATLRPDDGVPAASRVLLATDFEGHPLLLVSRLALHARALAADPRCSLLVGEPRKGDPLAHPRMSVFALAQRLETGGQDHAAARERFLARHPKAALYVDFPDFSIWRLDPTGASLNGGFAQAYELKPADLVDIPEEDLESAARRAGSHMNEDHADAVAAIAARAGHDGTRDWRIATTDRLGFEIICGDALHRIEFPKDAVEMGGYRQAFVALVRPVPPETAPNGY